MDDKTKGSSGVYNGSSTNTSGQSQTNQTDTSLNQGSGKSNFKAKVEEVPPMMGTVSSPQGSSQSNEGDVHGSVSINPEATDTSGLNAQGEAAEINPVMREDYIPENVTSPPLPQDNSGFGQSTPQKADTSSEGTVPMQSPQTAPQENMPPQQPAYEIKPEGKEGEKNPPLGPTSADHLSTLPNKKVSKFKLFVIVSVVLIIIIYAVVGYLFLKNRKVNITAPSVPLFKGANSQPTATPTPQFNPKDVKIKNGDVILEVSGGDNKILVRKDDYSETGITGFAKVTVSTDNNKICFESWPPSPEPALYLANSDGTDAYKVASNRQNCLWSKDSKTIYYKGNGAADLSGDLFSYDITKKEEKDLTNVAQTETDRKYDLVGLSADGSKLICTYTQTDSSGEEIKGDCEIDLAAGEITTQ